MRNIEGERDLWRWGEDVYWIKNVCISKGVASQENSGEQWRHAEADQERTGGLAVWVRRCGRGCLKVGNDGKLTRRWADDTGRHAGRAEQRQAAFCGLVLTRKLLPTTLVI